MLRAQSARDQATNAVPRATIQVTFGTTPFMRANQQEHAVRCAPLVTVPMTHPALLVSQTPLSRVQSVPATISMRPTEGNASIKDPATCRVQHAPDRAIPNAPLAPQLATRGTIA